MSLQSREDLTNLTGKTAIVTGGAVGIGQGISYRLAEAGANVLVVDYNQDHLNIAKQAFSGKEFKVEYLLCDVSLEDDDAKITKNAVETFGRTNILIKNAA